jgi:hypothetical protein
MQRPWVRHLFGESRKRLDHYSYSNSVYELHYDRDQFSYCGSGDDHRQSFDSSASWPAHRDGWGDPTFSVIFPLMRLFEIGPDQPHGLALKVKNGAKEFTVAVHHNEASGYYTNSIPKLVIDYFGKGMEVGSVVYLIKGSKVEMRRSEP